MSTNDNGGKPVSEDRRKHWRDRRANEDRRNTERMRLHTEDCRNGQQRRRADQDGELTDGEVWWKNKTTIYS